MKYQCSVCGYIYDEDVEKVPFNDLPDDWGCPDCGAPKALFEPMAEETKESVNETTTAKVTSTHKKYQCTVCGYIYDEAVEGVAFADLPDDWSCPDCGAPKALFEPMEDNDNKESENQPMTLEVYEDEVLEELTPLEISALFSNLARGCEKQYQEEAQKEFLKLADYFKDLTPAETNLDIEHLANLVREDLDTNYKNLINSAKNVNDRGTLRITTWGEKVTRICDSLIKRYEKEGAGFLENTHLYICTVCGFLYVGEKAPEICPVCKVPGWKFAEIKGGRR